MVSAFRRTVSVRLKPDTTQDDATQDGRTLRRMRRSLRSWLWRVPLNQEVDEELSFHIEMRTRELIEKGVDPRIAREMVLARIGDAARLKRTCMDLGRKRDRECDGHSGSRSCETTGD